MRFIILLMMVSISLSENFSERFDIAYSHFNNSEYNKSIQLYEEVLEEGWHSEYLYYNLGNAYYRNGMVGQSIWAYNKAISLNPRLESAKYNLDIVSSKIKDRIVLPPEFLLVKIYINFKSIFSYFDWLIFGSILFLLVTSFFVILKLFIFNNHIFKKMSSMFALITFLTHLIILDVYLEKNNNRFGIIIFDNVSAYSGPFYGDNTMLFTVNEGTKVELVQQQGEWVEIVILNGGKAWIPIGKIRML